MTTLMWMRWLHLLAMSVWVGGTLLIGVFVMALVRAGASAEQLRASARAFGMASGVALLVLLVTGIGQVHLLGWPWTYPRLHVKLGLVGAALLVTAVHIATARRMGDTGRRAIQAVILLLNLATVGAAVWM